MYVLPSIGMSALFYTVRMYVYQVAGECMLAELLKNGTEGSLTVGCSQEPHKRIFQLLLCATHVVVSTHHHHMHVC